MTKDLWWICRAQFTNSTKVPVGALLFTVVTVKDERLVVACTWQDTVVASLVEKVTKDMKNWLSQIGETS
jgi:hypothetical protein